MMPTYNLIANNGGLHFLSTPHVPQPVPRALLVSHLTLKTKLTEVTEKAAESRYECKSIWDISTQCCFQLKRAHIQGLEAPELTERIPRIEPKRTQEYSAVFCISLMSGFHRNLQVWEQLLGEIGKKHMHLDIIL